MNKLLSCKATNSYTILFNRFELPATPHQGSFLFYKREKMSQDCFLPDGTVRVSETVTYYRYVPQKIYEIDMALNYLNDDELIKVMKYISRITDKRCTFKSLQKPMSAKQLSRAINRLNK